MKGRLLPSIHFRVYTQVSARYVHSHVRLRHVQDAPSYYMFGRFFPRKRSYPKDTLRGQNVRKEIATVGLAGVTWRTNIGL